AGGDHQPVAEPVHALVEEPLVAPKRRARADAARGTDEPRLGGHPHERPLEDAVVVARPADRRAGGERSRHVAVVAGEHRRADHMRDPVAARLDPRIVGHLLREQRQRGLRPLGVGDVAERLLEATLVAAAGGELRPVRPEAARDRVQVDRARPAGWPGSRSAGRALAAAAARGKDGAGHGAAGREPNDEDGDDEEAPTHLCAWYAPTTLAGCESSLRTPL